MAYGRRISRGLVDLPEDGSAYQHDAEDEDPLIPRKAPLASEIYRHGVFRQGPMKFVESDSFQLFTGIDLRGLFLCGERSRKRVKWSRR